MSATFHLYRLQQVDSQLDKVNKRLREIQQIIDDNRDLKRAKVRVKKADLAQKETEKTLKSAERAVQAQHIQIEQAESMLYGGSIKNPKEVQDLQQKAESLKRHLSTLQDVQIEAMLAHEEKVAMLDKTKRALKKLRNELIQQNSELGGEQTVLKREKTHLLKEREIALSDIPPEMLSTYDKLREAKNGFAVVSVMDSSCSACGAMLTPSQQQIARAELTYCRSCQRIIYAV